MKGILIKFRGKDIITKEYLYGDYISHNDGTCSIRVKDRDNLFDFHEYEVAVEKESVAQLLGYDIDGNEVYEGDPLTDSDGNYYIAFLDARVLWNATFGEDWALPFEQPLSRTAIKADVSAIALDFFNKVERIRREDKKEKWLKKGD